MSDDFIDQENEDQEPEGEEESFAEMFEAYSAGMKDDLEIGEKIKAKIISIGKDAIYLDTGTKVDGTAEKAELEDDEGNLAYNEGDEIELFVVAKDEHEIRLSKAISGIGGLALLEDAFRGAIPVEGRVSATCKGGFNVEMFQRRAFCPISQIDVTYVETPDDYVGQTFEFQIIQLENNAKNIVVSRRKLLQVAIEIEKKKFFETVKTGAVIEGRVTRLMPYGAFVELIPGLEGMVHISELSWSRVEKPEEAVKIGETVSVKLLSVADGDKKNQKKISLSMKQVDANPWDDVGEKIRPGDKKSGRVTRCMNFGVFVEIAPGIEGLVHISEMSYLKRIVNPEDVVKAGETVAVVVKDIDLKKRRIGLSMRDAEGDPWLEVSDRFSIGQVVSGTLEKKEKFGYFVTLSAGITGLLPKSKFSESENPNAIEQVKEGNKITVTVAEIHPADRKITLAPGDVRDEGAWKDFSKSESPAPMSDLAAKLQQAMANKKK
jgi:small subunit ribosomal protein S1